MPIRKELKVNGLTKPELVQLAIKLDIPRAARLTIGELKAQIILHNETVSQLKKSVGNPSTKEAKKILKSSKEKKVREEADKDRLTKIDFINLNLEKLKTDNVTTLTTIDGIPISIKKFQELNTYNRIRVNTLLPKQLDEDKELEQIYNFVQKFKPALGENSHLIGVVLYYRNLEFPNLPPRKITLQPDNFESLEVLYETLQLMHDGEFTRKGGIGSDALDEDRYELIPNWFDLRTRGAFKGFGQKKGSWFKYFPTLELENEVPDKLCGYRCLVNYSESDIPLIEYTDENKKGWYLDNYIELIKKYCPQTNICSNTLDIKKSILEKQPFKEYAYEKYQTGTPKYKPTPVMLRRITDNDFDIHYIHRGKCICENKNECTCKSSTDYILYDPETEHYSIMLSPNIRDNIFCSSALNIYSYGIGKNNDKLFKVTNDSEEFKEAQNIGMIDKPNMNVVNLITDIEAVTDFDKLQVSIPILIQHYEADNESLRQIEKFDKEGNKEEVTRIKNSLKCFVFKGLDCIDQFYKYLNKRQHKDKQFKIITWNGRNYDHFLIYHQLSISGCDTLGNPLYNNNKLFNFTINKIHDFFDLNAHMPGSLKNNCESYKVNCCSKTSWDFNITQKAYDDGKINEFLFSKEGDEYFEDLIKFIDYGKYDVLATAVLFQKYRAVMDPLIKKSKKSIYEFKTIASLSYRGIWLPYIKELKRSGFKLSKYKLSDVKKLNPNYLDDNGDIRKNEPQYLKCDPSESAECIEKLNQLYTDIEKYRTGGMVHLFNGPTIIKNCCSSMDICSMYPYIFCIAPVYYPSGDKIFVNDILDMPDGKLGMFYCDIRNQETLTVSLICQKTKTGNNWDYKGKLKNILIGTPMIDYLKSLGVELDIKHGHFYTDKIKSCELFKPYLELMAIKNEQDTFKQIKSHLYNYALRECIKLASNAISGKENEGLHLDRIDVLNERQYLNKSLKDTNKLSAITTIGNKILVSYTDDQKNQLHKAKSIEIGYFIYMYAKMYMYEHVFSKVPLKDMHYTDTDSCKMNKTASDKWHDGYASKTIVPHWEETEKYDPD